MYRIPYMYSRYFLPFFLLRMHEFYLNYFSFNNVDQSYFVRWVK